MFSECDEVADNMPLPPKGSTMDQCRIYVRRQMPDETITIVDNVAESLWRRVNQ